MPPIGHQLHTIVPPCKTRFDLETLFGSTTNQPTHTQTLINSLKNLELRVTVGSEKKPTKLLITLLKHDIILSSSVTTHSPRRAAIEKKE